MHKQISGNASPISWASFAISTGLFIAIGVAAVVVGALARAGLSAAYGVGGHELGADCNDGICRNVIRTR